MVRAQHDDARGADGAGLCGARRRLPGDQARQGAGVAGREAVTSRRSRRGRRRRRSTRPSRFSRTPRSRSSCSAAARARTSIWQPRIRLAERLGACVFTDLKQGAMFPSDNPHHYTEPFNAIVKEARQLMCEADVILSLDWMDLGGALRQAKNVGDGDGQDHQLLARPEPAHRRQHGVPGAAAGRRVRGNDRRRDGRRAQRGARRGPQGSVEGQGCRRRTSRRTAR